MAHPRTTNAARRTRTRIYTAVPWQRHPWEPERWTVTVKTMRAARHAWVTGELVTRDGQGYRCTCADNGADRPACWHLEAVWRLR